MGGTGFQRTCDAFSPAFALVLEVIGNVPQVRRVLESHKCIMNFVATLPTERFLLTCRVE